MYHWSTALAESLEHSTFENNSSSNYGAYAIKLVSADVPLKSDSEVEQPEPDLLNKSLSLTQTLGVTKFTAKIAMMLVTL